MSGHTVRHGPKVAAGFTVWVFAMGRCRPTADDGDLQWRLTIMGGCQTTDDVDYKSQQRLTTVTLAVEDPVSQTLSGNSRLDRRAGRQSSQLCRLLLPVGRSVYIFGWLACQLVGLQMFGWHGGFMAS